MPLPALPRRLLPAALAVLAILACGPAAASGPTLAELEARAEAVAPELRLAEADAEVLEHRAQAEAAQAGARLFGSLGAGSHREPVTDRLVRDYRGLAAQAGVRWPLLGAQQAQRRAVADARSAAAQARLRRAQARDEVLQRLRGAWVQAHRSGERAALAQAFLRGQEQALRLLDRRREAGLLLEADRLAFASMFDLARRELAREQAARESALRSLALLSGEPAGALAPTAFPWRTDCLAPEALLAQAARRPAVAQAQAALDALRQALGLQRWDGVEAGVTLAQDLRRDRPGGSGDATVLSLDVSVPLAWQRLREARRAEARAELARAELLLQARLAEDRAAVLEAFAEREVRARDLDSARRALQAAQEAWRIARLRTAELPGDVLERELQTRYALYQAAAEWSASRQRHELAQAALLGFAPPCEGPRSDAAAPGSEPGAAAAAGQDPGERLRLAALSGLEPAFRREGPSPAGTHGWFAWRGEALLEDPGALSEMPPGTRRLLLSFTGEGIGRLAREPQAAQRLERFLDAARRQGLRVELLLGEPGWVRPRERGALLAIVERLDRFAFDGIHLDLERSQLPPQEQADWGERLVETLAAVRGRTALPLALTTHHREFLDRDLVRRLVAAGLSEGVAMVYVAAPGRAADIARRLLALHPQLPISIAQSIEPGLERGESHFALGRERAQQQWRALDEALAAAHANHNGLIVQSWEDFREARP